MNQWRFALSFVVPGAPVGKGRPRVGRVAGHARMFTPAKTVAYEGLVAHAAQQAMAGRTLILDAVRIELGIDCAIPASWSAKKQRAALAGDVLPTTKPDGSNILKAVEDGMNAVVYRDDVQIVDTAIRKRYAAVPRVCVAVWHFADLEAAQVPALLAGEAGRAGT